MYDVENPSSSWYVCFVFIAYLWSMCWLIWAIICGERDNFLNSCSIASLCNNSLLIISWILAKWSNTARIQEIILFTTNDSPYQSTHTPKICNKNKTNIPATRWILYIIHHMFKINTLQCNVLMQFSSIKQQYIYTYQHPLHTITNFWMSASMHYLP